MRSHSSVRLAHPRMVTAPALPITGTTWDPDSNPDDDLLLSEGERRIEGVNHSYYYGMRSNRSASGGRYYVEFDVLAPTTPHASETAIGLANASAPNWASPAPPSAGNALLWCIFTDGGLRMNTGLLASPGLAAPGQVLGLGFDLDAGQVVCLRNGTVAASAAGVAALAGSGPWHLAYYGATGSWGIRIRSSQLHRPAGFTSWT